jgi:hypothetical protein
MGIYQNNQLIENQIMENKLLKTQTYADNLPINY